MTSGNPIGAGDSAEREPLLPSYDRGASHRTNDHHDHYHHQEAGPGGADASTTTAQSTVLRGSSSPLAGATTAGTIDSFDSAAAALEKGGLGVDVDAVVVAAGLRKENAELRQALEAITNECLALRRAVHSSSSSSSSTPATLGGR